MSSTPLTKHQASLSIEELLQQANRQQPNWLLTYLDVFVLIIMLFITLITLSDFETEAKAEKQQSNSKQIKKTPPKKKSHLSQPSTPHFSHPKLNKKPTQIQKDIVNKETPLLKQQHQQTQLTAQNHTELITTLEQKSLTEEKNTAIEDTKKHKDTAQLNEETLQDQLTKTVEDLGLTDAVNMKVTLGYAQLEIQDKILFKSSEATLLKAGETLLKKIAILLEQSSGLIYIEGHTDNRPINTVKFPSNWELGAARSTSVLHYLATQKLDVTRLRAVTYGATKPIADNSTKEGREKNRRVSLVIKVSDKIE